METIPKANQIRFALVYPKFETSNLKCRKQNMFLSRITSAGAFVEVSLDYSANLMYDGYFKTKSKISKHGTKIIINSPCLCYFVPKAKQNLMNQEPAIFKPLHYEDLLHK